MAFGTLSVSDLLATQKTIAEIGVDQVYLAIQTSLDAHNSLLREKLDFLCEATTDRQRRYGGPDTMAMQEIDAYGTPDAQKVQAGSTVGFPLRLYGIGVQWTRKYFENAGANEFAAEFVATQDADVKNMDLQIRRVLFNPCDTTFVDRLVDNVTIYPKAFANGDGAPLPVGPNGEVFTPATHTHYMHSATAGTLAALDLNNLIENVVEHYALGRARVLINRAQESTIRGFTTGALQFIPYQYVQVQPAVTAAYVPPEAQDLNVQQLYNRAIGIFGNQAAEVWVKPYIPPGYLFAFLDGAPKPLCVRERRLGTMGLVVAAEDEEYPLRARTMENEYGVGVWNRVNGAVLDSVSPNTQNGTLIYAQPAVSYPY
jgi:hypothetical protein